MELNRRRPAAGRTRGRQHTAHGRKPGAAGDHRDRGRGQALTEFALTLPFLLVILLFAIDVGQLFYVYVGVQNAAREAASYAASSTACRTGLTRCTDARILEVARQEMGGDPTLVLQSATCTATCTKSAGKVEHRITVSLTRPFNLVPGISSIPGIGGASFPSFIIGASATAVIQ